MKILGTQTTLLKQTIYEKKLTQAEFSRRVKIAYSQLNTYCNGANVPGNKIKRRIAEVLQVPVDEIFP